MKLITLNLWGGQVYEPLLEFIKAQQADTDVFCFQEMLFGTEPRFASSYKVRVNLFTEIYQLLPNHESIAFQAPEDVSHFQDEPLPKGMKAGQAMFVHRNFPINDHGGFRTYQSFPAGMDYGGKITGSCQWAEITTSNEKLRVLNLHGIWQKGTDKQDTSARLKQSRILIKFISSYPERTILCGDFNLAPDSQSMQILEKNKVNLVKEHGVTHTRSHLYHKTGTKFADYILVSPDVSVKEFQVMSDVVSDHLPLAVEVE